MTDYNNRLATSQKVKSGVIGVCPGNEGGVYIGAMAERDAPCPHVTPAPLPLPCPPPTLYNNRIQQSAP